MMGGIITARTGAGGFPLEAGYRDGFLVLSAAALVAVGRGAADPAGAGAHGVRRPGRRRAVDVARARLASGQLLDAGR